MSPDVAQLAWAVRELKARAGAPDRLFGAFEQLQVPLAEVREQFGIPGMRPEAARRFRDKALMKATLRAAGVPCARHASSTTADDAWAFARDVGFPLVAKPPAGAGARNTERLADDGGTRGLARAASAASDEPAAPRGVPERS